LLDKKNAPDKNTANLTVDGVRTSAVLGRPGSPKLPRRL
jgi:hypothetical protein